MLEIQYTKTGSKEKPSYEAILVWHDADSGAGPQVLPLATIEKTEVETEVGGVTCWSASFEDGTPSIRRKTLGALRSQIEGDTFKAVAGDRALRSGDGALPPKPKRAPRKVKPSAGDSSEAQTDFTQPE